MTYRVVEQEQRRAYLERVSASLSHAVAGPLNVISGKASLLAMQASDAKVQQTSEDIGRQTRRLSQLLKQVREFAEAGLAEPSEVALDDLTERALEVPRAMANERGVQLEVRAESQRVRIRENTLHVAIYNLLVYVVSSAASGSSAKVNVGRRPAATSENVPPQDCVVVETDFEPESAISLPSTRKQCDEPWFAGNGPDEDRAKPAEVDRSEVERQLLLAGSCGLVRDRGGWSSIEAKDHRFNLSFSWPL